jgi:hypothetical protein
LPLKVVPCDTGIDELEADFVREIDNHVDFSVSRYDAEPGRKRLVDSVMRLCSPLL